MPILAASQVSPIENPIPDANNHTLYYIIAGAMVLSAAMLWPYFRHRYPCLTVSDLKQKEKVLDNAYEHFRSVENLPLYGYGFELESMTRRRIALKRRASKIRVRSLELDATSLSICKIYLGFHPEIVGDIVTWNHDVEIIVRDILTPQLGPKRSSTSTMKDASVSPSTSKVFNEARRSPSSLYIAVVKQGANEIPGLMGTVLPERLGPKRATKIRRFFNLSKEDDVRKYVRREVKSVKKENAKPYTKAVSSPPFVSSAVVTSDLSSVASLRHKGSGKLSTSDYRLALLAKRITEKKAKIAAIKAAHHQKATTA
uniref:Uncharacterized protein n=1 Tax=Moniliophthora roreri TaxID=221103 RepID=A0A0W0F8F7_MONRR